MTHTTVNSPVSPSVFGQKPFNPYIVNQQDGYWFVSRGDSYCYIVRTASNSPIDLISAQKVADALNKADYPTEAVSHE